MGKEILKKPSKRILVLYVAESREPVPDTSGRLRWRVDDSCAPVDRAEWWLHRERAQDHDSMADRSALTARAVTAGAMALVRADLRADDSETDTDILRKIAALRAVLQRFVHIGHQTVRRFFELAEPLADSAADLGQLARPENNKGNDKYQNELRKAQIKHSFSPLRKVCFNPSRKDPLGFALGDIVSPQ